LVSCGWGGGFFTWLALPPVAPGASVKGWMDSLVSCRGPWSLMVSALLSVARRFPRAFAAGMVPVNRGSGGLANCGRGPWFFIVSALLPVAPRFPRVFAAGMVTVTGGTDSPVECRRGSCFFPGSAIPPVAPGIPCTNSAVLTMVSDRGRDRRLETLRRLPQM